MTENENLEQKTRVIFLMEKYAHYIFHRFFEKPGRDRALRILCDSGTVTQKVFADKTYAHPPQAIYSRRWKARGLSHANAMTETNAI